MLPSQVALLDKVIEVTSKNPGSIVEFSVGAKAEAVTKLFADGKVVKASKLLEGQP